MSRDRWKPIERELRRTAGPLIAGVDEVGRGPLAGPVVACAVIMPPDVRAIAGVDDSKRLTARARERLAVKIRQRAVSVGIGAASVREIDRVNIYQATIIAMRRALKRLNVKPDCVLIDGNPIRSLEIPHTAIIGGDDACYTIACASIVAKVTRDRYMKTADALYPAYGFGSHVGYITPDHTRIVRERGPCEIHRRSWRARAYLPAEAPAEASAG